MPTKIGFIGAGGIAGAHLKTLGPRPDAQIVALCDVNRETAQAKAEQYGGRVYTDWAAMLEQEELDALFICVPPFAHGEMELAAIARRLPLFIEKPIALDLRMAAPILRAIQEADLITTVAYKYRWDEHVLRAREMLAGQTLGLVVGHFWTSMPGAAWWRVQEQSGGQMVEQTTHIVDLARYLCGEITHVQAFEAHQVMHRVAPDASAADAATANLRFACGAVGNISNTYMIGAGGTSGLNVMAHRFRLTVEGGTLRWWAEEGAGELENTGNGYVGEVEAFLAAVQEGDKSRLHSDYADAFRTLAATEAANVSGQREGEAVEVERLIAEAG
jgi:predicted dehydrogenase